MDALKLISDPSLKAEVPQFNIGDTVRVGVRVHECENVRVQNYEGIVIARKGSGVSETFTVRRMKTIIWSQALFSDGVNGISKDLFL